MPDPKDDAELLEWFAAEHRCTVYTDVPVTGPQLAPWSPGCSPRFATIAVFPGSAAVRPFDREMFEAALVTTHDLTLLAARGYADRTVFGQIVSRSAYFRRTWEPTSTFKQIALVRAGSGPSNVAPAYEAAGFTIMAPPSPDDDAPAGRGPGRNDPWEHPGHGEDEMLHALWNRREHHGWWLAEVPVGFRGTHNDGGSRRIDAVVVGSPEPRHSAGGLDLEEFGEVVAQGVPVELIEAKKNLNADTIGQLLCGADLFSRSWPGHGTITLTACVRRPGDEAVQWLFDEHDIAVEVVA